jgi:RNA polymerase sigma-70 factor (ECF subfamily)
MPEELLVQARAGDPDAFRELVTPYQRELRLHCYRMLGSLTDAEDLLQETLLSAWRGLGGYQGRASLRAWLYRIATNRCLNAVRDQERRRPPAPVPPFQPPEPSRHDEVTWLQPYPDTLLEGIPDRTPDPQARYQVKEAVELAFIAGLQRLPPRQAAILILRDVVDYSTTEVAELLGTSPTAVKAAVQRARATLEQARAATDQSPTRPTTAEQRALARRFGEVFTQGDVDGLIGLLTEDAWLAMPPASHVYEGIPAITAFLRASLAWRGPRRCLLVPTGANTQPAYAVYLGEPGEPTSRPAGLIVLTLQGNRIRGLTRFLDDKVLPLFALPPVWPG